MPCSSGIIVGCSEKIANKNLVRSVSISADIMTGENITGQIMYLNVFGLHVIIFNSLKPAFELLDRRANIYSDRARLTVANEVLCGGLFTAFMRYGDVLVYFPFLLATRNSSLSP
jgi:hypothetical protein